MDTSKLTFLLIYFLHCSSAEIAVQLERFEQIGGEHLLETSALRVRKYNRTTFTANGTFLLLQDIDETYEVSILCLVLKQNIQEYFWKPAGNPENGVQSARQQPV